MKSLSTRSPITAASTRAIPQRLLWTQRVATACLILIALFWLVILLLAAALKWYVVPNIDSLRPRVEAYASSQLQRPVLIKRIVAEQGAGLAQWLPQFDIQGLRILPAGADQDAIPLLSFAHIRLGVTPLSLLQLTTDHLSIEAPTAQALRSSTGVWSVAGFELVASNKPSPAMDWLFSQRELLITQGTIDFTDDLLNQPSVRFSQAQLLLRNGLRSHHLRLDATPPAAWGQSLQLLGQFRQPLLTPHAGDWQAWTGTAYAAVTAPTPSGFAVYLPKPARDMARHLSGTQSLAAWGQIQQGQLASADLAALGIPNVATLAKVHIEGLGEGWGEGLGSAQRLKLSGQAKLANADGAGDLDVQWQQTPDALGQLDLKANLQRLDVTALHRYLALIPGLQGSKALDYLHAAFERGTANDVRVQLNGELKDFPYTDPKTGTFKVTGQLADTQFHFAPGSSWPRLQQAQAKFDLVGMALTLSNIETQWAGLAVKGDVLIADLKQPVVVVRAQSAAPLHSWINLVQTSPLQGATGALFGSASGTGLLSGRVQITVPASAPAQTKVAGTLTLQNDKLEAASLLLHPSAPVLTDLKGGVSFTESSFAVQQVTGKALGGEFKVSSAPAGTAPSGTLLASGTVNTLALGQWQGLASLAPWLTPVLTELQGQTAYSARLAPSAPSATNEPEAKGYSLVLESNLVGLQSKLPEPLTKVAATPWPLRLEHTVDASSPVQRTRLQVVDLLDVQLQQDAAAGALRGSVRVGKDAQPSAPSGTALPERGINVLLQLATLDTDAWLKLAPKSLASASTSTAIPPSTTSNSLPTQISAAIGQLTISGRRFDQVVLGATQQDGTNSQSGAWRLNAKSADLDGYFEYRPGQLSAKLAHLTIPDNQSKSQLERLLQDSPSSLPALDIVVDEFELSSKRLGRLEIQAVNQRASSNLATRQAIEWRVQKLWLTNADAAFKGTGVWDNKRVDLQFALDINDSGALLTRLGLPGTLQGGKGSVQGRVGWRGSPLALHYPSMAGQLKLDFAKGQFLKVDPGAGRLLSVISLQALPRLFKLDFRDVFSDGFAFDSFGGDAQIKDGVVSTSSLQMKSVLALVSMNGQADLAKETQDLRVLVLPDVNAGGASLLATLINPVVGAATYLAQLILRRPLVAAATKEYLIQGTWQNPKVSQVGKP